MIERAIMEFGNAIRPGAETLRRRFGFVPAGWCIAALVVALVGGRALWIKAGRPAHLRQIAEAYGSVGLIYGQPQTDRTGARVTFVQQGEQGLAVCLADADTHRRQVIYEEFDPWARYVRVWPWSPDDRYFIYSGDGKLGVCEAATGKTTDIGLDTNRVTGVAWLSADEFICVNSHSMLRSFQKLTEGQWQLKFTRESAATGGTISSLVALDTNTVAWLQDNQIWRLNLSAPAVRDQAVVVSPRSRPPETPPKDHLVLWLDASRVTQENGSPVTFVPDQSTSGNDAVPSAQPPTCNASGSPGALNGKNTLRFVSGGNVAKSAGLRTRNALSISGTAPRTMFTVLRRTGRYAMLVDTGTRGTNGTFFGLNDQFDFLYLPAGWGDADNTFTRLTPGWHILEALYDGETESGYVNGGLKGSKQVTLNTGVREVEIGLRTPNQDRRQVLRTSEGDFAELLIYNAALSDAQRQEVRDYLNAKWFGGQLPADAASGAVVWLDPKMNGLTEFSYAKETGQFLLSRVVTNVASLWRCSAGQTAPETPVLVTQPTSLQNLRWLGDKQYAFTNKRTNANPVLVIGQVDGSAKTTLFDQGNAGEFTVTPDGKRLVAVGIVSNEVSEGVWEYDTQAKTLQCVVAGTEQASPLARRMRPLQGRILLPISRGKGRFVDYFMYPPANYSPHGHKKYPVVFGNTTFVNGDPLYQQRPYGPLWAQALANCGAYVVIVDRRSWNAGREQWPENVAAISQAILQNPTIDPSQVFLFATGDETEYVTDFLTTNSMPLKGMMLLNPVPLPKLSELPLASSVPKLLVSCGELEHSEAELEQYAENVRHRGVSVTYVRHKGAALWLQGKQAVGERTEAMIRFVFED